MGDFAGSFKASYIELIEEAPAEGAASALDSHLTPQQLTDFHHGSLSEQESRRLRDHLLECRECFEIWRDMRSFAATPTSQASREDRGLDVEIASLLRMSRRWSHRSSVRQRLIPLALAASLIAAAGLAGLVTVQQRQIRALSDRTEPYPNPAIIELAEVQSRRGGSAEQPIEIMAEAGFLLLITPHKLAEYPEYQVRIIDSQGTAVHVVRGLEKNPRDDSFSLWVPPGSLAAGELSIELHGVKAGKEELILEYKLRVCGED